MEKFSNCSSKILVLPWKDIDTDMIIPAQYLTSVASSGFGDYLFRRFRESDPDFIFNRVTGKSHSILLAGANFGCGSSREHAVWALRDFGIRVVIAPSFSDIFTNNAFKNGLLLIQITPPQYEHLREKSAQDPEIILKADLKAQTICTSDWSTSFSISPFRKRCLLEGVDDLGYLLEKAPLIAEYRKANPLYVRANQPA